MALVKGAEPDVVSLQLAVEGHCCLKPMEEVPVAFFRRCRCSSTPCKAPVPQRSARDGVLPA